MGTATFAAMCMILMAFPAQERSRPILLTHEMNDMMYAG
jgi:hypothetical protein